MAARALPLLLLLALSGCRQGRAPAPRIDPGLAALIPAKATGVIGIENEELRATGLYKRYRARLEGFGPRQEPLESARELLLASTGRGLLVAARGDLPAAAGLVLLEPGLTVSGSPAEVRAAQERRQARARPAWPLLARAEEVAAGNQVWAVGEGWAGELVAGAPGGPNLANLEKILAGLRQATLGADLRNGLQALATGECRSGQDAKRIADSVRGLVGLARLTLPDDQLDLLRALDGVQVEQQGQAVRLKLALPEELAAKLIELMLRAR